MFHKKLVHATSIVTKPLHLNYGIHGIQRFTAFSATAFSAHCLQCFDTVG